MKKKQNKRPILKVITLGHPTLRKIAREVKSPLDPEIKIFAADLLASMKSFDGVGIAAPQVNRSIRMLVIASAPSPFYPKAPKMKPLVMINPSMLAHSGKMAKGWEGCGSLMGVRARISRYTVIDVEFIDLKGKIQRMHLVNFVARVFQHELDHLNGIMFTDHVSTGDLVASEWLSSTLKKKGKDKK